MWTRPTTKPSPASLEQRVIDAIRTTPVLTALTVGDLVSTSEVLAAFANGVAALGQIKLEYGVEFRHADGHTFAIRSNSRDTAEYEANFDPETPGKVVHRYVIIGTWESGPESDIVDETGRGDDEVEELL